MSYITIKNPASFNVDIHRGDAGEEMFMEYFPTYTKGNYKQRADYDLICKYSGATVELKTDYYSMERTPNIIVEYYSDIDKQKLGGPWRCPGTTYFVYFYIQQGVFLWFPMTPLLERLNSLGFNQNGRMVRVPNLGYTTGVHKVPRKEIMDICVAAVSVNNQGSFI